ncbi:hypothetical protein KIN20_019289 [Parelaphostrongylus tenuis]|uniref:Uncharacterized protein n=1 Tax=Parelaphostrongylus tenuis TaxID=148309 RepID=A0AAD5MKS8_PARTN|nr:hypothetical protein KIN20_019289 [Parelaphostrongylus tenuis]
MEMDEAVEDCRKRLRDSTSLSTVVFKGLKRTCSQSARRSTSSVTLSTGAAAAKPYHVESALSHLASRQRKATCRRIDKEEVDQTGLRVPGSSTVQY